MADIDGTFVSLTSPFTGESLRVAGDGCLVTLGGSSDSVAPTIENFSPSPGTPINRDTVISFDVLDNLGLFRRVEIFVTLGDDTFVVHDGDQFRGSFTNLSTRTLNPTGFGFNIRKNGGWITPPRFEVHAVDTSGNEAN